MVLQMVLPKKKHSRSLWQRQRSNNIRYRTQPLYYASKHYNKVSKTLAKPNKRYRLEMENNIQGCCGMVNVQIMLVSELSLLIMHRIMPIIITLMFKKHWQSETKDKNRKWKTTFKVAVARSKNAHYGTQPLYMFQKHWQCQKKDRSEMENNIQGCGGKVKGRIMLVNAFLLCL